MSQTTTIGIDTSERHRRKYANKGPFHRLTLGRFHDALASELHRLAPASVLDFGCGEGFLLDKMLERNVSLDGYVGIDLRQDAIADAKNRHPDRQFLVEDLFSWPPEECYFDLVLASQVLEHLFEPERYLKRLVSLSRRDLLLTVPYEPWFQLMNLTRGRDVIRLGNHPEHINHWNTKTFNKFVEPYATVARSWGVFPFVFLHATVK